LKGEVLRRGLWRVTGLDLPVFPKRRFQHGAVTRETFRNQFGVHSMRYRSHLLSLHQQG
jgi:asparagine synthase (glutamine-hydrolysing)